MTFTPVAGISGEPARFSLTVAPAMNPVPARFVIATVDPRAPVAGVIAVTAGAGFIENPAIIVWSATMLVKV